MTLPLVGLGGGCVERDSTDPERANVRSSSASGDQPRVEPNPAVAAIEIPPVTDALVYDALQRWLQARNERDFAAYSAMYARQLIAIEWSAPAVVKSDRAGWLARQRTELAVAEPITPEEPEFFLGVGSASVRFRSGVGNSRRSNSSKLLVWELEDGQLRITREETLPVSADEGTVAGLPVRPIINVGDDAYLVLDPGPAGPQTKLSVTHGVYTAIGGVMGQVPSWRGKPLRVLTSSGTWCPALGQEMITFTHKVPPRGEIAAWNEQGLSDATIAKLLSGSAASSTAVRVATAPTLPCDGSWVLALEGNGPEPELARALDDGQAITAAKQAFLLLTSSQKLHPPQRAELVASAPSEVGHGDIITRGFELPKSGRRFVWVAATSDFNCVGAGRHLSVLFEVNSSKTSPAVTSLLETPLGAALSRADSILAWMEGDKKDEFEVLLTEVATRDIVLINHQGQTRKRVRAHTEGSLCPMHEKHAPSSPTPQGRVPR